ncbi:hypothetical protein [Vibrio phage vB_ValP_FGH]|nr:hypothetical protein [Vibrio phage vB_ValP_FGH]
MAMTVETIREARWREGKRFIYLDTITALAAGASENVLICVGDKNVIVEGIGVEANVEELEWEAFAGTQFTEGTGSELVAIARNAAADSQPGSEVTKNPTITNDGQSLSGVPLKLIAQIFRNNNYYLNEQIIENDFVFLANTCYLFRLTNTSAEPTDIQLAIDISNE